MSTEKNETTIETPESDYPIEIYTDERIEEFLAENTLTAEEKKRLEEKLEQPKARNK